MDNSRKTALLAYQTALNQYYLILSEELEFLDTAWRSLDEVFQGSVAEEFTGFWTRTLAEMEDSRLEVQKILNFIQEIPDKS
ncbi:MAG: hypothetical protein ACK47N_14280 [Microcystis sp.]|uniref:Uncharacterized protein n=6 Tax=Microcystis TaxID=1125 RepID=A0A2H6BXY6_MICAE|nr:MULTISPECIES: hypothetical protein [Microcystis]MBD2288104.1 hypothetical protein [Microcystis wesenbergii FACHB-1317]NCQ91333.1 hypothetical protein [Microcystis aeruginosa LG13-13]NCR04530.1 hypothetical protein [Microcystis aeruginosa LG13-03]NCR62777.1 hypothetical protein [Microcystis aeruginosa LG11-05]REJ41275.1 MAG: hypothetical protein DWQ54_16660 [Microcystis flos-aquae TF09]REJ59628.1 MAG: hypothetical protein DWQ58_01370 [Microcystis aeruginosa TA09]TRU03214.1 MAG: hypothetica